ncbi:MAG: tetratricopeptide repeat protein [Syntrophaceae bacterium]|nr:tetratricopeptide repeat protein [Syntrophaceae bacterium]
MTKPKKIIKKKLKKPDEFISFTERAFHFITHHFKSIAVGGGIVLFIILSLIVYQKWETKNEENASQLFHSIMETYQGVRSPYREGSIQEYKKVIEKLNEVIDKFPRTPSGRLSLLYKGNLHLRLGEFDEAITSYETFLQKAGGEKLYLSFALEGLGYSYEGKKDYEKAIHAYQKILELGENFRVSDGHLALGRCYEKLGKNKEAVEQYKSFVKIAPKSVMANAVLRSISNLEKSP